MNTPKSSLSQWLTPILLGFALALPAIADENNFGIDFGGDSGNVEKPLLLTPVSYPDVPSALVPPIQEVKTVPEPPSIYVPSADDTTDSKTEAVQSCPDGQCNRSLHNTPALSKISVERQKEILRACYAENLVYFAKQVVRSSFGNRSHSRGQCAYGVRLILDKARYKDKIGAGVGEGAYDFQGLGYLERYGFRNILPDIMKEKNYSQRELFNMLSTAKIPQGAVIIFKGPRTDEYARKGFRHQTLRPLGQWYGHIAVTGEMLRDDQVSIKKGRYKKSQPKRYFYTDGRTEEPAIARRYVSGIFVMENCKYCKKDNNREDICQRQLRKVMDAAGDEK